MHAHITAYKGKIVCQLLANSSNDDVVTSLDNPGVLGQVIMHSEKNVGVSPEALELLKKVRPGRDAIGVVDWFESVQGDVFSWIGGPYAIVDIKDEAARGYSIRGHVVIANDVPEGAKEAIDVM